MSLCREDRHSTSELRQKQCNLNSSSLLQMRADKDIESSVEFNSTRSVKVN